MYSNQRKFLTDTTSYTNIGLELHNSSVDEYPDDLDRVLALFTVVLYFVLACKDRIESRSVQNDSKISTPSVSSSPPSEPHICWKCHILHCPSPPQRNHLDPYHGHMPLTWPPAWGFLLSPTRSSCLGTLTHDFWWSPWPLLQVYRGLRLGHSLSL